MNTEATPAKPYGGEHPLAVFITSASAAIVVAGGFGIILEAFIIAGADLFDLGETFIWVASALTVAGTLWLFAWTFARSVHVERRLRHGLEIDEPKLSILANLKGYET
jgi:hypothetical protein